MAKVQNKKGPRSSKKDKEFTLVYSTDSSRQVFDGVHSKEEALKFLSIKEKEAKAAIKKAEATKTRNIKVNDASYKYWGYGVDRMTRTTLRLDPPACIGWAAQKASGGKVRIVEYRRTQADDLYSSFFISQPITMKEYMSWIHSRAEKIGKSREWKESRIKEHTNTSLVIEPHLFEQWTFTDADVSNLK